MANTFTSLQQQVFQHTGLDASDATNLVNVKQWINFAQQDVCSRWPWNFMLERESITTVPDTLGTCNVVNGSSSFTDLSSLLSAGNIGYFVQFAGANDWYRITGYSTPDVGMETAYLGPTGNGMAYTVRKFFYSLSSSCDRILDIRNWDTPCKLFESDPRTLDELVPLPESTNSSYAFIAYGYDSAGNVQIQPYPWPSDARLFEIRTYLRITDLVDNTSSFRLPDKWRQALVWGANSIAFMAMRKADMAQLWNSKYESFIKTMKMQEKTSEDEFPILRSIDSVQRSKWIGMPGNYPVVTGG